MELYDAIFCDDIRFESNHKLSLMGLYNDKIILHVKNRVQYPLPVKLATLLRFKLEAGDPYPEHFEFIYYMNGKNISKLSGKMNPTHDQTLALVLMNQALLLEAGDLGFSIKLFNKDVILLDVTKQHNIKIIVKNIGIL